MAQVGAGTRAGTWDVPRPRGIAWPSRATLGDARKTLQRWLASDVAAGRLLSWIPIAFGFGIVCYFTADREPSLSAALALAAALSIAAVLARAKPFAFPLLVGLAAVAAGFAAVTLKSARVAQTHRRGAPRCRSSCLTHWLVR